jgi:hypothetical protein
MATLGLATDRGWRVSTVKGVSPQGKNFSWLSDPALSSSQAAAATAAVRARRAAARRTARVELALGNACEDDGDLVSAAVHYGVAAALDPSDPEAHAAAGLARQVRPRGTCSHNLCMWRDWFVSDQTMWFCSSRG